MRYGVSDGFRISSDPQAHQQDQILSSADRDETRQNLRKSATGRNQAFNVNSGSGGTDESTQYVAPFKAVIKSPAKLLAQHTQDDESASAGYRWPA